ncbi:TerC family protein [Rhodocytophaga aerolata]|uniref:TerC family protein n=1 Tax=Rhodocytophaga aerolata TaxID=455078 RepID=A0ABT8R5D8_9BACT|nr:TerC family protein [Rhodocytophaga aerolata]MDO1447300.1 TerC family protein [Rhodocytophaga aerolata]
MDIQGLFTTEAIISLLTLSLLEIVLGIDNIIFISIISDRLPKEQQKKARTVGILLALIVRIGLLFGISWIVSLKEPLFYVFKNGFSGRDIILFLGGLFLLGKSTTEIHHKLEGDEEGTSAKKATSLRSAIIQIILLDIVFSFDSILTAVGLVDNVLIMIIAVIIALGVMLAFATPISTFVNTHPSIKMLALSFLIMIGLLLVAEAFHVHVPKGYVYFAMAFSFGVELLNLKLDKKKDNAVKLRGGLNEQYIPDADTLENKPGKDTNSPVMEKK